MRGSPKIERAITAKDVHQVVLAQLPRSAHRAPRTVDRETEDEGVEREVRPPRQRDACIGLVSLLPCEPMLQGRNRDARAALRRVVRECEYGENGGLLFLGNRAQAPTATDKRRDVLAREYPLRRSHVQRSGLVWTGKICTP